MARSKISVVAAAWFLAATQVAAGPIATAGDIEGDSAAATSELASLGGLLQALGAGVIGNGALLYPTQATPHQREESEILASDTATRVFKKVKSILKDGGINEDDNGDDESKSVTYLIKPAMIFHKEELPPPNPLAGNVLPLPGGALMYTPTPTGASPNEPTSGPAASIKAAYGNLFAASPYTPSYTLNKPHAAVIVEEVTDLISLKSSLQRLEDQGEDVDDDSDDEDDFGRKRRNKPMKIVSLETIDSTSTFVNPFTRADFPFGMMTPPQASPVPTTPASSSSRKTIRRVLSKTSEPVRASLGKDGGITVVNNAAPSTSQGTTIVIPAASLQSPTSAESPHSESHSAETSHSESHSGESSQATEAPKSEEPKSEEPKSEESSKSEEKDDLKANEVTRMAHKSSAHSMSTHVKGLRRDAAAVATSFDPLGATEASASAMSSLDSMASETAASATPTATVGSLSASPASTSAHPESTQSGPARRKMRIVRVYEVKKSGSHQAATATTATMETPEAAKQKRDFMPVYDAPAPTAAAQEPVHVSNWERVIRDEAEDNDNDNDSDEDETTVELDGDSAGESDIVLSDGLASDLATDDAEAEAAEEKAREEPTHNTSSKSLSIETIGGAPASETGMAKDEPAAVASSSTASEKSEKPSGRDEDSDSDSDDASENADSDSDSDDASEDARESDDESDESDKEDDRVTRAKGRARVAVVDRDQQMDAIQRMAVMGLREAEKAVEDFELNSDPGDMPSDDVSEDASTTSPGTPASAILSADEAPTAVERDAASPSRAAVKRAVGDEDDDEKDDEKDDDEKPAKASKGDDDDDGDDKKPAKASKGDDEKPAKASKNEDDDSDGDDSEDSDKSADSGSDSESDTDEESTSVAKSTATQSRSSARQSMAVENDAEKEARKALSEAAAESFQQVVDIEATLSESAMSAEASDEPLVARAAASGNDDASDNASGHDDASDNASGHDDASDNASDNASGHDDASDNASDNASDELDYEFETEAGVNSDGEEVEFVTQLVPDSARKNVNETPSVVVMASIDEEYEEDFATDSAPAHKFSGEAAPHVQRNAADQDDEGVDGPVVRGAEPTPDIDMVKQSQNRAINIGMGNLRRRV
ncbi:hypothetical protein LPJ78_001715 [Coemansia sp. RSA 989]|nr:hypothetical protein LPJ78_001715 [Coemansia sp. RSA 989]